MRKSTIITAVALAAGVSGLYMVTHKNSNRPQIEYPPLPPNAVAPKSLSTLPAVPLKAWPTNINKIVITWGNDTNSIDQLQSRVAGNWQNVINATSSPVTLFATQKMELFRLVRNAPSTTPAPPAPINIRWLITGSMPTVIVVDWQNTCVGCESVNIERATGTLIWTQLAQLPPTTTTFTDSNAPHISTNANYYRVRSKKNGVNSL